MSTADPKLNLQTDAGCDQVYTDVLSGVSERKVEVDKALAFLRPGDTLVVWRLDRLGRSLSQLVPLINDLRQREIGLVSLVEAIDTATPTGNFFFQITDAFAELARNLNREGTRQDSLRLAREG